MQERRRQASTARSRPPARTHPPAPAATSQLLDAISGLQRGLTAGPEERARVDELARRLEKTNPTRAPLASDLINGQWELLYTTRCVSGVGVRVEGGLDDARDG